MKHFSWITLLLLLSRGTLLSASGANDSPSAISPFSIPSTRNLALGGPHVAYTDDINSLFINPAALRTVKQFSAAEVSLGAYGDSLRLMDIINHMDDAGKLADTLSRFIDKSPGGTPLGVDLRGPIAVGRIKNGWGWGLFDRVYGGAQVIGKNVQVWGSADLVFTLGYAFRVVDRGVHTVDVGILGKAFNRLEVNSGRISLTELVLNNDILNERLNFAPFTIGSGLDLGVQYRLADNFTVGLTINDLVSTGHVFFWDLGLSPAAGPAPGAYMGYIEPAVNLGVSCKLIDTPLLTWAVMADYKNLGNLFWQKHYESRNGWLNVSLGTELILFRRIAFRAGMNEMLPAVGMGLDLAAFKLDAAFYGKELSSEPGGLSTYAMDLGVLFRY
jgi:hypothetical protein